MEHNGFEYVDLGLSVNWATCNVGAEKPTESGLYFQWGIPIGYTVNDMLNGIQRFERNAIVESPTTYQLSNDIAHTFMGGKWRVPSDKECRELINWATTLRIVDNNVILMNGNDESKSLCLPLCGYLARGILESAYYESWFQTSSYEPNHSLVARSLKFDSTASLSISIASTFYGNVARGVFSKD